VERLFETGFELKYLTTVLHRVDAQREKVNMIDNEITEHILRAAFKVHSVLGPGLLESSYKACLSYEMIQDGLFVEAEKPMPLIYRDVET